MPLRWLKRFLSAPPKRTFLRSRGITFLSHLSVLPVQTSPREWRPMWLTIFFSAWSISLAETVFIARRVFRSRPSLWDERAQRILFVHAEKDQLDLSGKPPHTLCSLGIFFHFPRALGWAERNRINATSRPIPRGLLQWVLVTLSIAAAGLHGAVGEW